MSRFFLVLSLAILLISPAACKNERSTQPVSDGISQTEKEAIIKKNKIKELKEEKEKLEATLRFMVRYKFVTQGLPPTDNEEKVAQFLKTFMEVKRQAVFRLVTVLAESRSQCKSFAYNYIEILDDFEKLFLRMASESLDSRTRLLIEARLLTGITLFNPMVGLIGNNAEAGVETFDETTRYTCPVKGRKNWIAENLILNKIIVQISHMLFGIKGLDAPYGHDGAHNLLLKARQADDFRNEIYFTLAVIPPSIIFWHLAATRGYAFLTRSFSVFAARPKIAHMIAHLAPILPEGLAHYYLHKNIFQYEKRRFPRFFLSDWEKSMDLVKLFNDRKLDSPDLYMHLLNAGMQKVDENYYGFLTKYQKHIDGILKIYGNVDAAISYKEKKLEEVNSEIAELEKK